MKYPESLLKRFVVHTLVLALAGTIAFGQGMSDAEHQRRDDILAEAYADPPETVEPVKEREKALEGPEPFARYCFAFLGAPEKVAVRGDLADRALRSNDADGAFAIARHFVGVQRIRFLCRAAETFSRAGERDRAEEALDEAVEIAGGLDSWGEREVAFLLADTLVDFERPREAIRWSFVPLDPWKEAFITSRASADRPGETRRQLRRQALGLAQAAGNNEKPAALAKAGLLFVGAGEIERAEEIARRAATALQNVDDLFTSAPAAAKVAVLFFELGDAAQATDRIRAALDGIAASLSGWRQTGAWMRIGREINREKRLDAVASDYWDATEVLIRRLAHSGENKTRLYELAIMAAVQLRENGFSTERREQAERILDRIDEL